MCDVRQRATAGNEPEIPKAAIVAAAGAQQRQITERTATVGDDSHTRTTVHWILYLVIQSGLQCVDCVHEPGVQFLGVNGTLLCTGQVGRSLLQLRLYTTAQRLQGRHLLFQSL